MAETLVCDVETNGYLDTLTKLWTIQIGTAEGEDVTVYADEPGFRPLAEGAARMKAAARVVFHNGFLFDLPAINRFFPGTIDPTKLWDTLVGARLSNPETDTNTLDAWGEELGILKGRYQGDFQTFDNDLVVYGKQDIVVTRALYHSLQDKLNGWGSCVETEMRFAWIMALQEKNGFTLDVAAAQELDATFRGEMAAEAVALRSIFPPIWRPTEKRPFIPKKDSKAHGYVAGAPITKVALQQFNPGSRHHVGERLKRLGWKPKAFNKDGAATLNEDLLTAMPWPEAKQLVKFFTIRKMVEQISEGKSAWLKWVKPSGRVHGRVNTIGCAPGRCSHSKPNLGQVNKKDMRMRAVWKPRAGWKLVGIDADGVQARGLSHYLARYDGGAYAAKIVNGNKTLKTDEHASNLQALPYLSEAYNHPYGTEEYGKARDGAKTCLYCVIFGGQDPKLGRSVKEACRDAGLPMPHVAERQLGGLARTALFRAIIGFDKLAAAIQEAAADKGYLVGLDGRHVFIRSKHSALVFLMQAFEAAVMKLAGVIFYNERAPAAGWTHGTDYAFVVMVHDEYQLEARPEIASELGSAFADCIAEAGRRLGSRCPLLGTSKVGDDWAETH